MGQIRMPESVSKMASWIANILEEPRRKIGIIQMIIAVLAFMSTMNFDTKTRFVISCYNTSTEIRHTRGSAFVIEYPFDLSDTPLEYAKSCTDNIWNRWEMATRKFDIDFSSSAKFYVLIGVVAFFYSAVVELFYIFQFQKSRFFSLAELFCTALLIILWFASTYTWAFSVEDMKNLVSPHHLIEQFSHCGQTIGDMQYKCIPRLFGEWSVLYISLFAGVVSCLLGAWSMWFVCKSIFHRRTLQVKAVTAEFDVSSLPPQYAEMERRGEMIIRILNPASLNPQWVDETSRRYGYQLPSTIQFVEIVKRPFQIMGFYIRQGDGIYISRVALGSAVYQSGCIRVGDEVLSVNMIDVQRMSLDDISVIVSIPKRLVLTIRSRPLNSTVERPLPSKHVVMLKQNALEKKNALEERGDSRITTQNRSFKKLKKFGGVVKSLIWSALPC